MTKTERKAIGSESAILKRILRSLYIPRDYNGLLYSIAQIQRSFQNYTSGPSLSNNESRLAVYVST